MSRNKPILLYLGRVLSRIYPRKCWKYINILKYLPFYLWDSLPALPFIFAQTPTTLMILQKSIPDKSVLGSLQSFSFRERVQFRPPFFSLSRSKTSVTLALPVMNHGRYRFDIFIYRGTRQPTRRPGISTIKRWLDASVCRHFNSDDVIVGAMINR